VRERRANSMLASAAGGSQMGSETNKNRKLLSKTLVFSSEITK
jgi:hypothetical protein